MLQLRDGRRLVALLDAAADEHEELERIAIGQQSSKGEFEDVARRIHEASHRHAVEIVEHIERMSAGWNAATAVLRGHRLHSDFLLQSDFISHALKKPFGYAGDHALMEIIYRNKPRGRSTYAIAKNDVYQNLPAAAAVRSRADGLTARLRELPTDAKVLSLACGSALEVQRLARNAALAFDIDLLDHDWHALALARGSIMSDRANYVVANAFDLIKGRADFERLAQHGDQVERPSRHKLEAGSYDLVYSAGLYDYVQFYPLNPSRGVTGLTSQLFKLIRPGGKLIVGNFMTPGGSNRHQVSHQFMMEAYSDWRLIYRSADEIRGFAGQLVPGAFEAEIVDETLAGPLSPRSVIGHLVVTRLC